MLAPKREVGVVWAAFVVSLLALSGAGALGTAPVANAQSVISITATDGSSVCPSSLGGTWSGTTCTVSGTFTLNSGTTLDIGAGASLTVNGGASDAFHINGGTINNAGTLTGASSGEGMGFWQLSGTINNAGTMVGTSLDYIGFNLYAGTINNAGTMIGIGEDFGIYTDPVHIINNAGTMEGTSTLGINGISNSGVLNDYCGVTPTSAPPINGGGPLNALTCDTVTFAQSGLPADAIWGVATAWGPFTIPTSHSGTGASITVPAVGALTYSYDSLAGAPGATYVCGNGCTGSATVAGAVSFSASYDVFSTVFPPGAAPSTLSLTTYGGSSVTGSLVSSYGSDAVYNIPAINQTLLSQQVSQGNFTLFPNAVTICSTTADSQVFIRVSGFSSLSWGGAATNSTEFIFTGWESFLTPAAGWPSMPACGS